MTNKEAKRILQFCIPMKTDKQREAINLAIKALEEMDARKYDDYDGATLASGGWE